MNQPKFTKEHYEFIAEIIKGTYKNAIGSEKSVIKGVVFNLGVRFHENNPQFKLDKFIDKCIS